MAEMTRPCETAAITAHKSWNKHLLWPHNALLAPSVRGHQMVSRARAVCVCVDGINLYAQRWHIYPLSTYPFNPYYAIIKTHIRERTHIYLFRTANRRGKKWILLKLYLGCILHDEAGLGQLRLKENLTKSQAAGKASSL